MATWNRVSIVNASESKNAQPTAKTVGKAATCFEKAPEYVGVKYSKLVERVTILENSSFKAQNPARLEAQLNRVEQKIKANYLKAAADAKKYKQQQKNIEEFDERCQAIIKKYEMKLYELEERTGEILAGAEELKAEMKEYRDTAVNVSFDSCMIYHNLKQTDFRADGDYTLEEKAQLVREHVF